MIILCVLLVILTLISIIGGSIRFDESSTKPITIEPEPKEKYMNNTVGEKLMKKLGEMKHQNLMSENKKEKLEMPYVYEEVRPTVYDEVKNRKIAEGFQGSEYARFA